jgi:hypothetical protein
MPSTIASSTPTSTSRRSPTSARMPVTRRTSVLDSFTACQVRVRERQLRDVLGVKSVRYATGLL